MKIVGKWGRVRYGILRSKTGPKVQNGSEGWFLRTHEVWGRVWIQVLPEWAADHRTTLLTTIGGQTLPNPVRVPDNLTQPAVLIPLMEGPI